MNDSDQSNLNGTSLPFSPSEKPPASFFVTGGTVPSSSASYIARRADHDLREALLSGEFCYVLNARQMGKSSLSVRTVATLTAHGVQTVFLDLTKIGGQNVTPEQWYAGLLAATGRVIGLRSEMVAYWKQNNEQSFAERFFGALREVALEKGDTTKEGASEQPRLVIFIDEIDATRSLPFSVDEFFGAIRAFYNSRALDPLYRKIAFCLVGSALPSELIDDPRISPFNIGRRIELKDFTWKEVQPMAAGLSGTTNAEALLLRVFFWTNGNPYLTQSLCAEIAAAPSAFRKPGDVDALVARLFFDVQARSRNINLADVSNRLLRLAQVEGLAEREARAAILTRYRQVWEGRRAVPDDETDPLVGLLKLSGIVRSEAGQLRVRCRLYQRVFDGAWVDGSLPDAELRRQRAAFRRGVWRTSLIAGAVLLVMAALSTVAVINTVRARQALEISRHILYDAQIDQARNALGAEEPARARMILDGLRPESGQKDLREFSWRLLDRLAHTDADPFPRSGSTVQGLDLSRDGKYLAACTSEGIVQIWKPHSRRLISTFTLPSYAQMVRFSPDARLLFLHRRKYGTDTPVEVWDWQSKRRICTLPYQTPWMPVVFSPDGKTVAVADRERGFVLLSMDDDKFTPKGAIPVVFDSFNGSGPNIAFTADGKRLIVPHRMTPNGKNGLIEVRAAVPPYAPVGLSFVTKKPMLFFAVSPDGQTAAVGNDWNITPFSEIEIWNLTTGKVVDRVPIGDASIGDFTFSKDGRRLLATGFSSVTVFDVAGQSRSTVLYGGNNYVYNFVLSADGQTGFTDGSDGYIRQWNLADALHPSNSADAEIEKANIGRKQVDTKDIVASAWRKLPLDKERFLSFNSDATLTASRVPNRKDVLKIYDVVTGQTILLHDPDGGEIYPDKRSIPPQFTSDYKQVWAVSRAARKPQRLFLRQWNLPSGTVERTVSLPATDTQAVTFDTATGIITLVDPADTLHYLDATTGRDIVPAVRLPERPIAYAGYTDEGWFSFPPPIRLALTFRSKTRASYYLNPDRRHRICYTLTPAPRGRMEITDTVTGKTVVVFDEVYWQSQMNDWWTEDGRYFVSSGMPENVYRRFDINGKRLAIEEKRDAGLWFSNALSRPGHPNDFSLVFNVTVDGQMDINDIYTGAQVHTLRGSGVMTGAGFSPDGRTLAVAQNNKTVTLWDMETDRYLCALPVPVPPVDPLLYNVRFSRRSDQLLVLEGNKNLYIIDGARPSKKASGSLTGQK